MSRSVESIYQEIADAISESLAEPWTRAWINAKMEDDNGELEYLYQKSPGGKALSFAKNIDDRAYDVYLCFDELRSLIKTPGKKNWSGAVFTLEANGEFKIDFSYD